MSIIFIFLLCQFLKSIESNIVIKFNRLMSIIKEQDYSLDSEYVNQRVDNPYRTTIRIGNPSQHIPGFLRTDEYDFYLSNYNCPKYEKYYTTVSSDFSYITPKEYFDEGSINEYHFKDSLYFEDFNGQNYIDIKINNYSFNVDNNMIGPQCFHIGSQVLLKKEETGKNIVDVLFKNQYAKSYLFEYTIINDDEMHLTIGLELNDEEKKKYRFISPITIYESEFFHNQKWGLTFDNIHIKDYNNLYKNQFNAELDISVGCLLGNTDFHEYFKKYLQDNNILVEPKICEQEYLIYFFSKDMNGVEKLKNLELKFYNKELGFNFTFNYEDLVLEKRNGYYLLIAFEKNFRPNWKFGFPFFKKYKFNFDINSKKMGFFCPDCPTNQIKENNFNFKNVIIIISIIFIAIAILVIGIFIGKKLYEVRKARANELLDLYEYKENEKTEDNKEQKEENIN